MLTLYTGDIPADAVDIVLTRLDRLTRRAERLGFPVPLANFGPRRLDDDGIERVSVAINADGPLRLGDYEFVGVVSALADGTSFVTYAPGMDEHRGLTFPTVNYCDHCRTFRQRNDTYIVAHGGGFYQQVGSSCIKDFTGHDPSAIVGWLEAIEGLNFSDDDIRGWERAATRFYNPKEVIAYAARVAGNVGYASKAAAIEREAPYDATSEIVRSWMVSDGQVRHKYEQAYPANDMTESLDLATRQAVEELVDEPASSDWIADIIRLVSSPGIQWRHIGIVASAVVLGLRRQNYLAAANRPESKFFGSVGDRLPLNNVKLVLKRSFEGNFGTTYILRFDVDGNDAVWFASPTAATQALAEGDNVNLVGTIKGHELDRRTGRETTVLTRCKIGETWTD